MFANSTWTQRIYQLLLLTLLLGFAWLSLRIALSSAMLVQPNWQISEWENRKSRFDAEQSQLISERINRAKSFYNDSAAGYLLQARLQLLIASKLGQPDALIAASESAQKAIAMQPSDFEGWSLLAVAQLQQAGQKAQSHSALASALTIAPFEKANQVRLLPLIISQWPRLSIDNQHLAKTMIKAVLRERHIANQAVRLMIQHQNIRPFLALEKSDALQKKLMASLESKSE